MQGCRDPGDRSHKPHLAEEQERQEIAAGRAGQSRHRRAGRFCRRRRPRRESGAVVARPSRLDSLQDEFPRAGDGPADDDAGGKPRPLAEIAIDLRQADPAQLPQQLAHALQSVGSRRRPTTTASTWTTFVPWRNSIIWKFNRLFWQWLTEWERASGRGFEAALPSGSSDANHPQAVADSVAEFWRLLKDLDIAPSAAGGDRRARDWRRLGRARRGVARRVQGARRAVGHRLLPPSCASGSATTRPPRSSGR